MSAKDSITAPPEVVLGSGVYTPGILRIYDPLVLQVEVPWIWKCPPRRLVAHYDQHVGCRHLDVGVGTGYFLDQCRFPCEQPTIALLDLNPNSLAHTAARIRRYQPVTYRANVLEPIPFEIPACDSIGMNLFLHCLPGTLLDKGQRVFSHLKPFLNPGGVLFGSTILGQGTPFGPFGRLFMAVYNSSLLPNSRVLNNKEDCLADLEAALAAVFARHTIEMVGHVALFAAYN